MRPRPLALVASVAMVTANAATAAAPRRVPRPTVVVAIADSGVNPYHEVFYRPKNTAHPCTYVAGFTDCSIPALRLSVGKYRDYAKAVAADKRVWDAVKPHQWYWIPGTNIIGAVCDPYQSPTDSGPGHCILDDKGHGTATASSVLTEAPDALLVVHEGSVAANDMKTVPVVPDVQSHSWAPPAPVPWHARELLMLGEGCPVIRRRESLYFLAAGNEAPFPAILDCHRREPGVHVVGGAYPDRVSVSSWSTYDFASWLCRPVARRASTKEWFDNCGTSFSAPTAAGAAAAALLRLRRQDGYTGRNTTTRVSRTVTRAAFEQALRNAATYTPKSKFTSGALCVDRPVCVYDAIDRVVPLPAQAPYVFWGYGWLDSTVTEAVVGCARGRACPKKSAEATQWNDTRQRLRAR